MCYDAENYTGETKHRIIFKAIMVEYLNACFSMVYVKIRDQWAVFNIEEIFHLLTPST